MIVRLQVPLVGIVLTFREICLLAFLQRVIFYVFVQIKQTR